MRRLSIKLRVTLWYAGIMVLLAALALTVLLSVSNRYVMSNVRGRLENRVASSFREIEWDREDGKLDIDDDLEEYRNGVWLGIYDRQGYPLFGRAPGGFPPGIVFEDGRARAVRDGGNNWYVYDSSLNVPGFGQVWIRGTASQSDAEEAFAAIFRLALVLFPFLAALAAVGGYMITRQAFLPVVRMADTARLISESGDLSRRIGLGEGNDELYRLADTFDHMLDRLERQLEKEKQFTSDVSHELRTPISVIISRCEYALEVLPSEGSPPGGRGDGEEERRESLRVALEQARKMARLVSQLLALSRADGGRQQLKLETVNVSEICEITALELENEAAKKNITITARIQPDVLMRADETMMMRLFINLISNAITYGREGGHVEVGLASSDQGVSGYVKDDGIGISAEKLDRIWDRFYQADPSRTADDGRGAGLGLSMVRWIVGAHGGSVRVESRLGEGSCFLFEFPAKVQMQPAVPGGRV